MNVYTRPVIGILGRAEVENERLAPDPFPASSARRTVASDPRCRRLSAHAGHLGSRWWTTGRRNRSPAADQSSERLSVDGALPLRHGSRFSGGSPGRQPPDAVDRQTPGPARREPARETGAIRLFSRRVDGAPAAGAPGRLRRGTPLAAIHPSPVATAGLCLEATALRAGSRPRGREKNAEFAANWSVCRPAGSS